MANAASLGLHAFSRVAFRSFRCCRSDRFRAISASTGETLRWADRAFFLTRLEDDRPIGVGCRSELPARGCCSIGPVTKSFILSPALACPTARSHAPDPLERNARDERQLAAPAHRTDADCGLDASPVTRHTVLPTSSATSSAPDLSSARPTGRPRACWSLLRNPVTTS